MGDVAETEDGDRDGDRGKDDEKPGRQSVDGVGQRQPGRAVHEPGPLLGAAGGQHVHARRGRHQGRERAADERHASRAPAPAAGQHGDGDGGDPDRQRERQAGIGHERQHGVVERAGRGID